MDYTVHGILQARIMEWVAIPFSREWPFLQGMSPSPEDVSTQGSNPGLPHCRHILYQLSPPWKLKNTEVGNLSLLEQIFLIQELNHGLLHCRWIHYQLNYQGSHGYHKDIHKHILRYVVCISCHLDTTSYFLQSLQCPQPELILIGGL